MRGRIDAQEVNRRADLLALASSVTSLGNRPAASTGGGEWKGPCPFCGGQDRFSVEPYHQPEPRWMCRSCTGGKWKDAIEFARRLWPGLKFPELCERLAGGALPIAAGLQPAQPAPRPAAAPPALDWQASARRALEECQATLWQPKYKKVLEYLHDRGLQDRTIKRFGLGYCATGQPQAYGREIAGLWIPRGIVIPTTRRGEVWSLKIRLAPGVPCKCQKCKTVMPGPGNCPNCGESNKYRGVKGNRPAAIFNADDLETLDSALFVEGEFDCMIAWQEIGDLVPVATPGAATNASSLDLATWGRYLVNKRAVMLCFDGDSAGEKGAAALASLTSSAVLAPLPAGPWKDVNDFYQAGGDLRAWIMDYLNAYVPEQPAGLYEACISLGGQAVDIEMLAQAESGG